MKKLLLTLLFIATEANAINVKHYISATIGPFDASVLEFEYQLDPDKYAVHSKVRTDGMFNVLYPFEANYATTGIIKNGKMQTTTYHTDAHSRFNHRTKEMIYNNKGEPIYILSTKGEKEKKTDITPTPDNANTTDLQTVIAEITKKYNEVRFCAAKWQVFDGKRRFDVVVEDEGQEVLAVNDNSPFAGNAAKCSIFIDKLGAQGDDLLWSLTSKRRIYFWIMQDEATQAYFIAKIHINDTPLGQLNAYTTKIEVTK